MENIDKVLEKELNTLTKVISENEYVIVKFIPYDSTSVSVPSTVIQKYKTSDISKILENERGLLLPDASTAFSDPCSIHQTLVVLCSQYSNDAGDYRSLLSTVAIPLESASFSFAFDEVDESDIIKGIDQYHDIRSEIVLEGQKAGLELLSHYTSDKNCFISFNAKTPLELADAMYKLRILSLNIAASYNKIFVEKGTNLAFEMSDALKGKISKLQNNYRAIGDVLLFEIETNMNPYQVMYRIFYE